MPKKIMETREELRAAMIETAERISGDNRFGRRLGGDSDDNQ